MVVQIVHHNLLMRHKAGSRLTVCLSAKLLDETTNKQENAKNYLKIKIKTKLQSQLHQKVAHNTELPQHSKSLKSPDTRRILIRGVDIPEIVPYYAAMLIRLVKYLPEVWVEFSRTPGPVKLLT